MFISKLECPEHRGNHSLTSKCRLKNPKSMSCLTSLSSKAEPVASMFALFLVDLDKKYRNEIEKDKNNSVTYMEYVYFSMRVFRTWRKSLPYLRSADSKTLKSMACLTSLTSKPLPAAFMFLLFLADLDKKYRNEIEMDEK